MWTYGVGMAQGVSHPQGRKSIPSLVRCKECPIPWFLDSSRSEIFQGIAIPTVHNGWV